MLKAVPSYTENKFHHLGYVLCTSSIPTQPLYQQLKRIYPRVTGNHISLTLRSDGGGVKFTTHAY